MKQRTDESEKRVRGETTPPLPIGVWLVTGLAFLLVVGQAGYVFRVLGEELVMPKETIDVMTPHLPPEKERAAMVVFYEGREFNRPARIVSWKEDIRFPIGPDTLPGGIDAQNASVRVIGKLVVPADGKFTFHLYTDDGMRFWLDGKLVESSWPLGTLAGRPTAPIALERGQVPFVLEVRNEMGTGWVGIEWEGPNVPRRYIQGMDMIPDPAAMEQVTE